MTQIHFSRTSKCTIIETILSLRIRNPKIILKKIVFKETFITRVYRFPGLSRTCIKFPGLSSPGKCQNKIPGLSRISRTRTNPEYTLRSFPRNKI